MFDELLAEIKAARAAAGEGKYFTGLSHTGKALTIAGDIGSKYFEGVPAVTFGASGEDDETLDEIEAECRQMQTVKASGPVGAGWQDYMQYLTIILEIIKKIREGRNK